jgi:DHA2 family multidrug resistance protein
MMFAILMSITFLLPVFMQELLGFTATQSGTALMPRALAMAVAIPIVGRLYNRVPPALFISFGIGLVSWSAFLMSHYTLVTGTDSVIFAIVVQGFGFACLFVPLTTVSMSRIPRYRLADAAGLNSLLRQIGGSLGLAAFATLLPRYTAQATNSIATHLYAGRPEVVARLGGIEGVLVARGMAPAAAGQASLRVLERMVARQSALLAFEHMFLLAGVSFLFVLPLAFLLRRGTAPAVASADLH